MATLHAKLSEVTEGWNKWQLALCVGAPIALGLAGIWLYRRGRKHSANYKENAVKNHIRENLNGQNESIPEPGPLEKAQAAKNKGNKLFKAGQYDRAIECYTQAIEVCPSGDQADLSTFYQNRAAAYGSLGKVDQVVADTTEALKHNPRYIKALSRRAKAYENQGKLREALTDITAVCILEEFRNTQSLELADHVLKDLGRRRARETYSKQVPVPPSKFFVRNYLSGFANDPILQVTVPGKLVAEGSSVANASGDSASPEPAADTNQIGVGEAGAATVDGKETPLANGDVEQESLGPYQQALADIQQFRYSNVVELCTEELELTDSKYQKKAFLLRATFYILQGQGDKAIQDLQTLISMEDISPRLLSNAYIKLGSLQAQRSDPDSALKSFNLAAEVDPQNADVYYHRGQYYLLLEKMDEAIKDFSKCSDLAPNFPTAPLQKCYAEHRKALMYKDLSALERSQKQWQDLLRRFPTCSDGFLLYGQTLCDQGKADEADQQFRVAIQLEPDNPNTIVHQGLLKMQAGDQVEDAIRLIERAIELDPHCEYAYEVLGTIEVQRGNMPRASRLFNKAISLCRSEIEMAHLYSLLDAAEVQLEVVQRLGILVSHSAEPVRTDGAGGL